MGTRHLVAVVSNKKVKVAQYGQWDGYLEGQGRTVIDFIKKLNRRPENLERFINQVDKCRFLSDDEVKETWTDCGADPNSDMVGMAIAEKHTRKYPALSRDTGADVLNLIYEGKASGLRNSIDFAADSLFCEFAYVLDLDKQVLEIYTGFNKGKAKGRFARMKVTDEYSRKNGYGPVSLFAKVKFSDCNVAKLNELQKELSKNDEE